VCLQKKTTVDISKINVSLTKFHRTANAATFHANETERQPYELRKHLHELHVYMTPLLETYVKP